MEHLDEHAQTVWITSETKCVEQSFLIGLPPLFDKINELYNKNRSIDETSSFNYHLADTVQMLNKPGL